MGKWVGNNFNKNVLDTTKIYGTSFYEFYYLVKIVFGN